MCIRIVQLMIRITIVILNIIIILGIIITRTNMFIIIFYDDVILLVQDYECDYDCYCVYYHDSYKNYHPFYYWYDYYSPYFYLYSARLPLCFIIVICIRIRIITNQY